MKWLRLICLFVGLTLLGQNDGFQLLGNKPVKIPFKFVNNLIFVPMTLNGVEVTFLLDSGVSESLLFGLDDNGVNKKDVEKVRFSGLGESGNVEGLKSVKNEISMGKNLIDYNHTLYIILDEEFNISSDIGIPINGIMGYKFFKDHPVEIDFLSKKITIYPEDKSFEKKRKRFTELPISLEGNKPYLRAGVQIREGEPRNFKMLMDLGNSDGIWLFPSRIDGFELNQPSIRDFLGRGFNGDIFGNRNRVHHLDLAGFRFEKVLAAMPDESAIENLRLVTGRKGSVGNDVFKRFKLLIDYPDQKIYLRKNKDFEEPFIFNKSGLTVKQDGIDWDMEVVRVSTKPVEVSNPGQQVYNAMENTLRYKFVLKPNYAIAFCREDSPCQKAGLQVGDVLYSIGGKKVKNLTLAQINHHFLKKDGTVVTVKVERNGQLLKTNLVLEDPIPYTYGGD